MGNGGYVITGRIYFFIYCYQICKKLKNIISKITPFLIFTLVLGVVPVCLMLTGNQGWLVPQFWAMFAFIGFLTLTTLIFVFLIQNLMPEYYAQAFLGATVFKMLACLVFMLILVLKMPVNKLVFAADFFYLYFLNTGFEVYVLLRNLRNQNLK